MVFIFEDYLEEKNL